MAPELRWTLTGADVMEVLRRTPVDEDWAREIVDARAEMGDDDPWEGALDGVLDVHER